MSPWDQRPIEIANLLNPAFCGRMLFAAISGYEENEIEQHSPMPFTLMFVVLPIVLHQKTMETICGRVRSLNSWLRSAPEVRVQLPERTRTLRQITIEAVVMMIRAGHLKIQDDGLALGGSLRRAPRGFQRSEDDKAAVNAAAVLGKWFAKINNPSEVYARLGLRP